MAGVLTENLVLQKTKVDNIQRVRKLNVCAAQLSDIGVLRRACNLEILSLSVNELSELGVLSNCRRLCELYLRKNRVEDLNQVLHLSDVPHLTILNLAENPICQDPNYRRFVIAAVGSLRRLDDIDILPQEREEAYRVFPNLQAIAPPPSMYCDPVKGKLRPGAVPTYHTNINHNNNNMSNNNVNYHPQQQQQQRQRHDGGIASPSVSLSDYPYERLMHGNGRSPRRSPTRGHLVKRKNPNVESPRQMYAEAPGLYGYNGKKVIAGNNGFNHQPNNALQIGPTETGVVQAVKVLLSELSSESLDEVRRFMDALQ